MKADINNFKESYLELEEALKEESEALSELSDAFDGFVNMESFQGDTAETTREYIQDIQKPIIEGLKAVITSNL
ncbi:LXG domain of WXG superfamily protein [Anaerovirgula multivorans]|uniref:LXG domain of WXG superfamily protein n=1 Tax=Anaerovirgula multivorans TaxID=312168 RepID=A0A239C6Q5_9FIRM|nr:T7SS effector LXG polymorphic toxin [Anaerovirgula multivorans]SNS15609.1 LXG domain of WXG superfamily protein [Anaerovirgula multivorans]